MADGLIKRILKKINTTKYPLLTTEIIDTVKAKRDAVMNRLLELRGDGKVAGRRINAGAKGVWIWWKKGVFA